MSTHKVFAVGVCGRSGSGKSYVSELLSQKLDCPWYDADAVYHELLEACDGKPSECTAAICKALGGKFMKEDGTLDRKKLGKAVFSDKKKMSVLNKISHSYITFELEKRLSEQSEHFAVIDAALLPFSECSKLCDTMVFVTACEETALSRIIERDSISREAALERLCSQPSFGEYTEKCDYVIENEGDISEKIEKLVLFVKESVR